MNHQQIDLAKLNYQIVLDPPHIKILYNNDKFIINTPIMTIPFGIDTVYDKYYVKLQFDRYKEDIEMEGFFNLLMIIEQQMEHYIEEQLEGDNILNCEFNFKDKFDPTLNTKLVSYRSNIKTKIICSSGSALNYWNIKKGCRVKCKMELNGIWKIKDKFHYKWNLLEILVID